MCEGAVHVDDPRTAAYFVLGAIRSVVLRWLTNTERKPLSNQIPAVLELPSITSGFTILELDEFHASRVVLMASSISLDQCMFGATLIKATTWSMCCMKVDAPIVNMHRTCNHPQQTWIHPSTGKRVVKPHPTRNRETPIPAAQWTPTKPKRSMCYPRSEDCTYPPKLIDELIKLLQLAVDQRASMSTAHSQPIQQEPTATSCFSLQ